MATQHSKHRESANQHGKHTPSDSIFQPRGNHRRLEGGQYPRSEWWLSVDYAELIDPAQARLALSA